jgi:hypothetical protein
MQQVGNYKAGGGDVKEIRVLNNERVQHAIGDCDGGAVCYPQQGKVTK